LKAPVKKAKELFFGLNYLPVKIRFQTFTFCFCSFNENKNNGL
jgi:hypothetical protein